MAIFENIPLGIEGMIAEARTLQNCKNKYFFPCLKVKGTSALVFATFNGVAIMAVTADCAVHPTFNYYLGYGCPMVSCILEGLG